MLQRFTIEHVTFLILFAVLGTVTVIHDPDFYFHLVAGQYILDHHTLPHVDVFSFSMPGEPWHMHEWLFEVLVAVLYAFGGEPLIVWVTAALGIYAFYLAYRAGRTGSKVNILLLIPALVLILFYLPFVTQRPQIVTFFSYAVYLSALLAWKYRGKHRGLWLLPPLMVVWVNSHGAYLLGVGLLVLFTASEWLQWRLQGKPAEKREPIRLLGWVLLATVLASLLNPYFIKHWLFPFELMNREAMSVISEWRRPDPGEYFIQGYFVTVLIFIGQYLFQKQRPDLTEWLVPGVMIVASLTAVRHVSLAAMTLMPFFLITLQRPSRLTERFLLWRKRDRQTGKELGVREPVMNLILLGAVLSALFLLSPVLKSRQQQMKMSILPVKAVNFIEQNGIQGHLFNQYRFGGYLLYRLYPRQKVFIDIRADMYGDEMMRKYTGMFYAVEGWEKVFDSYGFSAVLCETRAPLVEALLLRGDYYSAYRDQHHVVLLRKETTNG